MENKATPTPNPRLSRISSSLGRPIVESVCKGFTVEDGCCKKTSMGESCSEEKEDEEDDESSTRPGGLGPVKENPGGDCSGPK